MTDSERKIITKLATSEPVVRNLVLLWDLYMNANHTGIDATNMTESDLQSFLDEHRAFVESFDFLKDLAIDNPGESSVLKISFEQRILQSTATDFLPFFGTDYGFCSLIKPQLNFDPKFDNLSFARKMFGPKRKNVSYR